jgi:hypothetical protein
MTGGASCMIPSGEWTPEAFRQVLNPAIGEKMKDLETLIRVA